MNFFEKVEFRDHSFNELFAFTSNYVYCNITLKNDNSGNRLYFWYKYVVDGVVSDKSNTTSIFRPSLGQNGFSTSLYVKKTSSKIKLRVYEENPETKPDAEYIESAEVDISQKILNALDTAKVISDFQVDTDGPAVLALRDTNFLDYFDATNVKIYDYETNTPLYDGPYYARRRKPISY